MAAPTYACAGIVLRKTKLSEADLIVTLLSDDGSQRRLVAKGARKPNSTFASRLELFSDCDLLCVKGKSLDIVSEARLKEGHGALRTSIERSTAATPCAELLAKVTVPDLPCPRLYEASAAGLAALEAVDERDTPAIAAAMLIKTLAFEGFRPTLSACACCGCEVATKGSVAFSSLEGGVLCQDCARDYETVPVEAAAAGWLAFLMNSTYREIMDNLPDLSTSFSMLRLVESLVRAHVGSGLKSLGFLFTSGIYG